MPKYLLNVSYTAEGAKGLLKEGGSKRRTVAREYIERVGGTLEAFYFAFGDTDVVLIADMPDAQTTAGLALALAASGAVTSRTTVLLTPEDIDAAVKKSSAYAAPGR